MATPVMQISIEMPIILIPCMPIYPQSLNHCQGPIQHMMLKAVIYYDKKHVRITIRLVRMYLFHCSFLSIDFYR